MNARFCPKCGAYWRCDCVIDELKLPQAPSCEHDWVEAVGVVVDETLGLEASVVVCRLCGLYAVHEQVGG